jgi:hypothetical protein
MKTKERQLVGWLSCGSKKKQPDRTIGLTLENLLPGNFVLGRIIQKCSLKKMLIIIGLAYFLNCNLQVPGNVLNGTLPILISETLLIIIDNNKI